MNKLKNDVLNISDLCFVNNEYIWSRILHLSQKKQQFHNLSVLTGINIHCLIN